VDNHDPHNWIRPWDVLVDEHRPLNHLLGLAGDWTLMFNGHHDTMAQDLRSILELMDKVAGELDNSIKGVQNHPFTLTFKDAN